MPGKDYDALGSAKNTSISDEGGMGKRGMGGESGRATRRPDREGLGGQAGPVCPGGNGKALK